jgi:hypothetical protein
MVSRISGRFISFYADDLSDMIVDDILDDLVLELQSIENKSDKTYITPENQLIAQDLLQMVFEYEN